ncbi:siderophore biosynthesis protein [Streptomyces cinnamoneus]|uniref:Siderophore biosynthesis protein n=1 Tax=Streptomyces cinnamoneus TaxID=53446 RepID=A0A2G1XB61_STRCJ|nr:IucA/IucC family siderophore biosynthesis protein [Streptomyces cinnamoneus]PHQ48452.1 siderophore biosynthesis protein [Streptomyces cinnamoneus]PPT12552.1 IucA/IucC family siderophore biosynthesis protein [Streptomyces cinnamoneus]
MSTAATARTANAAEAANDAAENDLLGRVLSTLLRENAYGLRSRAATERRPDGDWLRLPAGKETLLLPVGPEGFQCEVQAREPVLHTPGGPVSGLRPVLTRLRAAAPDEDRAGFDAFLAECEEALAAARLHGLVRDAVVDRLSRTYGHSTAGWTGLRGALAFDTLAAFRDHPVYPTGRARSGLGERQLRAYAPEFHPVFALRWLALPAGAVHGERGELPHWWPTPTTLGLPRRLDATHLALPVHPLTADGPLPGALRAAGLADHAHLAPKPWLEVTPTLSTRTVAVADDPETHLKLPLATATLGLRNRRTIKPGALVDGETGQRLLEEIVAREPRFAGTVLLADERTHLRAGHELLVTLLRRYPAGLDDAHVVPVAALLARAPDGRLVADALAERYYGGSLVAFVDAYLTLLLDWHTTLFSYGIALESHQQNTSVVLDERDGRPRLRLLLKDNDGPRVHSVRLAARLGGAAADLLGFDDRRILVAGDGPVADVFATITVHLCAGALAFELGRLGRGPLEGWLRQLRDRLAEATDRLAPGTAAVLRARVLDADRLPVKAMITAGTLLTKERSGAADINKYYVEGPNYLRPAAR